MKTFFVDGKKSPFAKVLCDIGGGELVVSTFGVNKQEVFKLFQCFKKITVIVDSSVTQRNDNKSIKILSMFAKTSNKLTLKTLGRSHHKMAIIDKKWFIITSANLQKNRSSEFYMISDYQNIDGADDIFNYLKSAEDL